MKLLPILIFFLAVLLSSCSAPTFMGGQPDPFDAALGQAAATQATMNARRMQALP